MASPWIMIFGNADYIRAHPPQEGMILESTCYDDQGNEQGKEVMQVVSVRDEPKGFVLVGSRLAISDDWYLWWTEAERCSPDLFLIPLSDKGEDHKVWGQPVRGNSEVQATVICKYRALGLRDVLEDHIPWLAKKKTWKEKVVAAFNGKHNAADCGKEGDQRARGQAKPEGLYSPTSPEGSQGKDGSRKGLREELRDLRADLEKSPPPVRRERCRSKTSNEGRIRSPPKEPQGGVTGRSRTPIQRSRHEGNLERARGRSPSRNKKSKRSQRIPNCKNFDVCGHKAKSKRSRLCLICFKNKSRTSGAKSAGREGGNPGNRGNAGGNPGNSGNTMRGVQKRFAGHRSGLRRCAALALTIKKSGWT